MLQVCDDIGVLGGHVVLLAEVTLEVVELGLGGIAQLDVGKLVVGGSFGRGDVFPASIVYRNRAGLLDDIVASVAVVAEEGWGGEHVFS